MARELGTKHCVVYGVDLCRMPDEASREAWRSICATADYVHFRNRYSYELVTEACGQRANVTYSTDLTMGYTNSVEADSSKVAALRAKLGLSEGSYVIWALAMPWSDEERATVPKVKARYEKLCGQLVRMVQKHGAGFTNVLLPFYHLTDCQLIADVAGRLTVPHIALAEDSLALEEKRALFAGARACVSMRFHGIMFSLYHGIPLAAVSYAPKATSAMQEAGLGEYCTELGIRASSCFFSEFDIDDSELDRICTLAIHGNDRARFGRVSVQLKAASECTEGELLAVLGAA